MRQGELNFCLGEDMYSAQKVGEELPQAADIHEKDSAEIKQMKTIINQMTAYEPAHRPSAERVLQMVVTSLPKVRNTRRKILHTCNTY